MAIWFKQCSFFSVTLHAQNQQQQARQMLSSAMELSVDPSMNQTNFASDPSMGSHFLKESWRRTWWELYVLDGMLAALHQQSSFKLNSIKNHVLLPCDGFDYSTSDLCSDSLRDHVYVRLSNMSSRASPRPTLWIGFETEPLSVKIPSIHHLHREWKRSEFWAIFSSLIDQSTPKIATRPRRKKQA